MHFAKYHSRQMIEFVTLYSFRGVLIFRNIKVIKLPFLLFIDLFPFKTTFLC